MPVDFSISAQFVQQGQDAGTASAASAMTGTFMGRQAAAVDSPMSLLADAAEEMTFAADTTDEFELSERKEREKTSESMIERVQMYQEMMHEAGKTRDMDELTRQLRQGGGKDQALREARERFPDPSDAWAALSGSLDELKKEGADASVLTGIQAAMDELQAQEGPAIRAGVQGALAARGVDGLGASDGLRDMYRQTVLEFGTVNDVLGHILERHGEVGFDKAMDFLFRALGNDLAADTPSMDKAHLESVHANLGQVRLLQSAHTLCDKMLERWENVHGVKGVRDGSLRSMDLLGEIVGLRNERFLGAMHIDRITARAQAPDIEHEVLFLQEMLNMTRSFPSQLFDGDQGRMKVLDAVQERVDNAIAREDEFLAAQDEG